MCDFGIVSAVVGVTSAVAAGVSAGVQADQESKASAFRAAQMRRNAMLARQQKQAKERAGATAAGQRLAEGRAEEASAIASIAASGLSTVEGSVADASAVPAASAAIDAERIQSGANRAAFGLQAESDMSLFGAERTLEAGRVNVAATGIGGAARTASLLTSAYGTYKRTR